MERRPNNYDRMRDALNERIRKASTRQMEAYMRALTARNRRLREQLDELDDMFGVYELPATLREDINNDRMEILAEIREVRDEMEYMVSRVAERMEANRPQIYQTMRELPMIETVEEEEKEEKED